MKNISPRSPTSKVSIIDYTCCIESSAGIELERCPWIRSKKLLEKIWSFRSCKRKAYKDYLSQMYKSIPSLCLPRFLYKILNTIQLWVQRLTEKSLVVVAIVTKTTFSPALVSRGFLPFLSTWQWAYHGGEFCLIVLPSSFLQSATRTSIGKQTIANVITSRLSLK